MEDKHLFLLVHGLGGNPRHLKSLEKALVDQFDGKTLVHVSKCNSGFKTMDGTVVCANRLLEELLKLLSELADKGARVSHISIVGYSFGGLISRYLIGLLEELDFFDNVTPFMFTTFATPHVGSVFPSKSFKYRVLNTLGSSLLGITGNDLFATSSLLDDMAEPDSMYFKGLERFEHHFLFANAVWDRTVPFWTSYLSAKNPFKDRNRLDLKYYDHLYGQPVDNVKPLGQVPFLVDMTNSKYLEDVTKPTNQLTAVEKRQRILLMCLFPFFAPVLTILLLTGTIYSRIRYGWILKSQDYEHPRLYRKFLDSVKRGSPSPRDLKKLENQFNEDLADLAGQTMEDMLLDTTNKGYGNGNILPEQITKGPPKPACCPSGLVEGSRWDLDVSDQTRVNIENLNRLPWKKYAVKLLHFNAHAEIVDRRLASNQGSEVMKFFARIAQNLVAEQAQTRIEQ